MVRIRIGAGWRHDPALRGALRQAEGTAARAAAVRRIVDVMAIEVDGVDIAAGRAEGPLLSGAEQLVGALSRLVAGDGQASVTFQDGAVELVLRRRGGNALLSVVALGRPTRLLARDVEVDLDALAGAAREAAGDLAQELSSLAGPTAAARRLLAVAARLTRASPAEPGGPGLSAPARARRARRRPAAPSCGFEIADEEGLIAAYRGPGADLASLLVPGRVVLRGASGDEVFSVAGAPFLVLGDLAAAAGRLAAAALAGEPRFEFAVAPAGLRPPLPVAVDLTGGTVSAAGRRAVPAPPLSLAQAFLEAALDFCAVVLARNPRQAANPHLGELRDVAAERLAHLREAAAGDLLGSGRAGVRSRNPPRPTRAPLGPGRMRRLRFRLAWQASVGPPVGPGLVRRGELLLACGREAILGLEAATGGSRWRAPGAEAAADLGEVLLAASGERLACLEVGTGRERWGRPLSGLRGLPWAFRLPGGLAALPAGPGVAAVDLGSGRVVWRFEPPAAGGSWGASFGAISLLGADTGLVYGLDNSGGLAWRLRAPGPLAAPPSAWVGDALLVCRTELGGSLLAVDPAVGRRRWEAPLDFTPGGPALPFAGRLAVPGLVAGDAVVAACDVGGAPAFTLAPSLGPGPLAPSALRGGLLLKGAGGACAALDRTGATRWTHGHESPHPPPGNLPALVVRGVALVPSEGVEALDEETGQRLGNVPGVAPARLLAGDDLSLQAVDAEGLVSAVRLEAHLSVLG